MLLAGRKPWVAVNPVPRLTVILGHAAVAISTAFTARRNLWMWSLVAATDSL